MSNLNKNAPQLRGTLLDVIPRWFERIQPLDISIITKTGKKSNTLYKVYAYNKVILAKEYSFIIAQALPAVNPLAERDPV